MPNPLRYKRIIDFKKKSSVAWYLAGGVALANCLGAWNAKGAASLAASYTDLTGHGHTLTVVFNTPAWTTTEGWKFNSADALDSQCDLTCWNGGSPNSCIIVRYTNFNSAGGAFIGYSVGTTKRITVYDQNPYFVAANGNVFTTATQYASNLSGVIAIRGKNFNFNGVDDGSAGIAGATGTYRAFIGGAGDGAGGVGSSGQIYITHCAIYDITPTEAQCAAIYAAVSVL